MIVDEDSTQCNLFRMIEPVGSTDRVLKTAWFSEAANKAGIEDDELCGAIRQVMQGQANDLGGGRFEKRLNNNMHRSIVLAKGRTFWVYEYLFAKTDRANIKTGELLVFRKLASRYESLSEPKIVQLLQNADFVEICDGREATIQIRGV